MTELTGKLPVQYHRYEICRFHHNGKEYPVFERRLRASLAFERNNRPPIVLRGMLDTGAPLCVIPHKTVQRVGVKWSRLHWSHWSRPDDSAKSPYVARWHGIECELGCVRVWYRPFARAESRGPFDMIAKFPKSDPANVFFAYDMLLGLNFLSEHWCVTTFQCHTEQHAGTIEFP